MVREGARVASPGNQRAGPVEALSVRKGDRAAAT